MVTKKRSPKATTGTSGTEYPFVCASLRQGAHAFSNLKFLKKAHRNMAIQLLLDGDWAIYTAGFASQKTHYVWLPINELRAPVFGKNQTEIKAEIAADGYKIEEGHLFARTEIDPLDHILHTVKHMINAQIEKVHEKFPNEVVGVRVFVDGSGNFRDRLGTIRPYKGNRIAAKPVSMPDIKQYLLDTWDAEVVWDQESDDAMAIAQTYNHLINEKSIICAVDKDMLQVPGYHLNPNKGWKSISTREGMLRLYVQAAQGDTTDNIAGAYKVGPKAAKDAFFGMDAQVEGDLWSKLVEVYQGTIEKYGSDPYRGLDAEEAALENMRLVYLRRQENELWLPPHQR